MSALGFQAIPGYPELQARLSGTERNIRRKEAGDERVWERLEKGTVRESGEGWMDVQVQEGQRKEKTWVCRKGLGRGRGRGLCG